MESTVLASLSRSINKASHLKNDDQRVNREIVSSKNNEDILNPGMREHGRNLRDKSLFFSFHDNFDAG